MPDDGTMRHNDAHRRSTSPWPFPVGSWIVPAFWLFVIVAALILRWLRWCSNRSPSIERQASHASSQVRHRFRGRRDPQL